MICIFSQALTIIIFVMHYNSFPGGDATSVMITTGTYVGYVIILAGIFLGLFTGTPISSRLVSQIKLDQSFFINMREKNNGDYKVEAHM